MHQFIQTFSQFINESKTNEMRGYNRYGRPIHHRMYRSRYRSSENPYIEPKDRMRAETLKNGMKGKVDPDPNGGSITLGNARKMAKAIDDTGKLMARMEAIAAVYPNNPAVIKPFVNRVIELLPSSKYAAAYRIGLKDGQFRKTIGTDDYNPDFTDADVLGNVFADLGLAAPSAAVQGNESEKIMYEAGFTEGQEEEVEEPAVATT